MTREDRIAWDSMQYQARLEARRGNNFTYLNEEKQAELEDRGYVKFKFDNGEDHIYSSEHAKDKVNELRKSGHYARVVVNPSYRIRGGQSYSVWYKKRKK